MGANKDQRPESGKQINYEAAVLDFLDKEMAAAKPNKKGEESGQEVDALVTDLLKQVITESDQPSDQLNSVSNSMEDTLSEFAPTETEVMPSSDKSLTLSDKAASSPAEARQDTSEETTKKPSIRIPFTTRLPRLALGMAPIRKTSIIAVASVSLLVVIGTAVFYLWGSSKGSADTPEQQPVTPALAVTENINMPVPVDPQEPNTVEPKSSSTIHKPENTRQTRPQPKSKFPTVASSSAAPAAPVLDTAVSKVEPEAPDAANPASETEETEPELPIVKPLLAQISAPSPLTAESNLAIDRSSAPPMPNGITLAGSALDKNVALTSQLQTPAGSRNLVPSVLISQVSPTYPELAIRSRTSGSVVLELHIDKEGKVVEATPVSGPAVFYNEAVKAAMQYRYRPATLNGKNVTSKSKVTMVFNLNR